MSAVEEIRKAIARLEVEREQSGYQEMNGWLANTVEGASGAIDDPGYAPVTNDPLFLILHRTIDAQIGVLTRAYNMAVTGREVVTVVEMNLARAINGTSA